MVTLRNRYQIIKKLSGGTFGQTYKAKDIDLPAQPYCVIKRLKPDASPASLAVILPIAEVLFEKEAKILLQLYHSQIPRLYAYFQDQDIEEPNQRCFYLVQDFVDGHTLDAEIKPNQRLGEQTVIELLVDILEVLDYLHQQGVIHRDLKPANIMRRNQDGKIVLIDFGAVKEIKHLSVNAQGQTESTVVIGTPGYMPSEQGTRRPKFASDVYAVGMIGIQALTGQYPHLWGEDDRGEVVWRNLAPQVSPRFASILEKMVKDHFPQRYQNAGLALEDLQLLDHRPKPKNHSRSGSSNTVKTVISNPQVSSFFTRREVILSGFGLVGLAAALLTKDRWSGDQPNPDASPLNPTPTPKLKTFEFVPIRLDASGQKIVQKKLSAEVLTEDLGNGIVIEMVKISSGTFWMGSPDSEVQRFDTESPQHKVTVPSFYLGKFTVTQAQWRQVAQLPKINIDLATEPSYNDAKEPNRFSGPNRPIQNITWFQAVEFCARLSSKTGKIYRLPSEAEWEWCADIWHDNYNGAPNDGRIWLNGEDYSSAINKYSNNTYSKYMRVLRGGSWYNDPRLCRCANRIWDVADYWNLISFRLCFSFS